MPLHGIGYALLALLEQQEGNPPAYDLMDKLESLTPGGSEFHESPSNCIRWIRERLAGRAKQVKRRRNAESRAEHLTYVLAEIRKMAKVDAEKQQGFYAQSIVSTVDATIGDDPNPWPDQAVIDDLDSTVRTLRADNVFLRDTLRRVKFVLTKRAHIVSRLTTPYILRCIHIALTSPPTDEPLPDIPEELL
jgi:hypothetical protein